MIEKDHLTLDTRVWTLARFLLTEVCALTIFLTSRTITDAFAAYFTSRDSAVPLDIGAWTRIVDFLFLGHNSCGRCMTTSSVRLTTCASHTREIPSHKCAKQKKCYDRKFSHSYLLMMLFRIEGSS